LRLGGREIVLQGAAVLVDGGRVSLSRRECELFAVLTEQPGVVVLKEDLERRVWGEVSGDGHRLHVTVGRLRQRLGAIGTAIEPVYRRGYRLATTGA
jgi:uroporphyrinogen-III synthase